MTETSTRPEDVGRQRPLRMVVGVDGSDRSDAGLAWAFAQSEVLHGSVDVVLAWDQEVLAYYEGYAAAGTLPFRTQSDSERELGAGVERSLARLTPQLARSASWTARAVLGPASAVLEQESRTASLLVLTRQGHWAARDLLVGSVVPGLLHHSACPVVVVPEDAAPTPPTRVVVGCDHTAHARSAVSLAARLAEAYRVPLRPVIAREPFADALLATREERREWDDRELVALRDTVAREAPGIGVEVHPAVLTGAAGPALVDATTPQDLLVVGARSRSGLRGWFAGSATTHTVHRAACPVVVAR